MPEGPLAAISFWTARETSSAGLPEAEASLQFAVTEFVATSVAAKNVTVGGSLQGDIKATERTEMRKSAVVNGDVQTRRIAIEEGAFFKGKLEILTESKSPAASGAGASAATASAPSPAAGTSEQRK